MFEHEGARNHVADALSRRPALELNATFVPDCLALARSREFLLEGYAHYPKCVALLREPPNNFSVRDGCCGSATMAPMFSRPTAPLCGVSCCRWCMMVLSVLHTLASKRHLPACTHTSIGEMPSVPFLLMCARVHLARHFSPAIPRVPGCCAASLHPWLA